MEIVKDNAAPIIDVLNVPMGHTFETQGRVFIRVYTIEVANLEEGVLKGIVGVDLSTGGYFCINIADLNEPGRFVTPVASKVIVG